MKTSTGGGSFGEDSSKPRECFGEVQVGRINGRDALNAVRDEDREVRMKMSTGGGSFGEIFSKPMGCFRDVKSGRSNWQRGS